MAEDDLKLDEFAPEEAAALAEAVSDESRTATDLAPVFDVPVAISAVLGRSTMSVAQLLQLTQGSVLELDRKVGEAIDIYVNNRLVARACLNCHSSIHGSNAPGARGKFFTR